MRKQPTIAYWLSGLVAALAAFVAAVGLFYPAIYRDPPAALPQEYGQDLVTLLLGVPLLLMSLALAARGSLRGRLAWLGALGYMLYTYASYAFGAVFNPLFLAYVALFSLSLFALIVGMLSVDLQELAGRFGRETPVRSVAVYLAAIGGMVALMWLGAIVPALLRGEDPALLAESGTGTLFIQVLDLGVVAPLALLAARLLWRRSAWGFLLAGIVLVKGGTLGLAVLAMIGFMANAGLPVSWGMVMFFSLATLAAAGLAVPFYAGLHERAPAPRRLHTRPI